MEPFEVFCIEQPNGNTAEGHTNPEGARVKSCNEYTVTGIHRQYGREYYFLQGFPHNHAWRSTYFATLPGLTADEMASIEKEAIIL